MFKNLDWCFTYNYYTAWKNFLLNQLGIPELITRVFTIRYFKIHNFKE